MAYNSKNIPVLDSFKNKNIGISINYNNPSVFNQTLTTKDSIKNNLLNYLLTDPGERYFNNNFGVGLSKYLFETINSENIEIIKDDITEQIVRFFPNIEINELNIFNNPSQNNYISINLKFNIVNTDIEEEINIVLENDQ